jgi:hypothetical protein
LLYNAVVIAQVDPWQLAVLPLVGVLAGTLGGLLGVGGGMIMIPAMVLILHEPYGPGSLHVFKLAALATAVVVSVPATLRHARAGAITPPLLYSMVPAGFAGAIGGVSLAGLFAGENTHVLERVFGTFMVLFVAGTALQSRLAGGPDRQWVNACPVPRRWVKISVIVGLPAGIIAGLLGIGGGLWAVPAQHLGLGVRLRTAIANSNCTIVLVAAVAAVAQSVSLGQMGLPRGAGWLLALWLAPGAIAGGWIGAALTHKLPADLLRNVFYIILLVTGLRMAWN